MEHRDDDDEPMRRGARRGGEAPGGGTEGQAEGRCKPRAGQPAAMSEPAPHGELPSATGRTANCGGNPFGERDMLDLPKVRKVLERRVRKKRVERGWFDLTAADLEEAVAVALADLFGRWWDNPKSLGGTPERNVSYAVWRGGKTATAHLWHLRGARKSERATRPPAWVLGEREPYSERLEQVRRAVEALPDDERFIIEAIYWRGLSYREAAEEHGAYSYSTLRRRHLDAERRLREQLRSLVEAPDETANVNTS